MTQLPVSVTFQGVPAVLQYIGETPGAVSGLLQYEQWMFPLLAASRQSNVTSSVQLAFYPYRPVGR